MAAVMAEVDRDMAEVVLQQSGTALRYLSASLREDTDIVLLALEFTWDAFELQVAYAHGCIAWCVRRNATAVHIVVHRLVRRAEKNCCRLCVRSKVPGGNR